MDIIGFLASTNYIIYNKQIAKLCGIDEAILLGELCSFANMYKMNEFFFLQQKRIIDDTALSETKIRNATKSLVKMGVIIFEKKGVPAKYYYKIQEDNLRKLLEFGDLESSENKTLSGVDFKKSENVTSRGQESELQEVAKADFKWSEKQTSRGQKIKALNNKQDIINKSKKESIYINNISNSAGARVSEQAEIEEDSGEKRYEYDPEAFQIAWEEFIAQEDSQQVDSSDKNKKQTFNRPSYQEIMDEYEVEKIVQNELWRFIQHRNLNGKILTNETLENLIIRLNMSFGEEIEKAAALETARKCGYMDVKSAI